MADKDCKCEKCKRKGYSTHGLDHGYGYEYQQAGEGALPGGVATEKFLARLRAERKALRNG